MKKIFFLLLLASSAMLAQSDVVKFQGKISNRNSDAITLTGTNFKRTIALDKDGNFSDSFAAPAGLYELFDGAEYTELFLKNGFDLTFSMDAKNFDESIVYKGKGAKENNILAQKVLDEEVLEPKIMAAQSDPQQVMKLFKEFTDNFNNKIQAPGIDPGLKLAVDAKNKEIQLKQQEMQAM